MSPNRLPDLACRKRLTSSSASRAGTRSGRTSGCRFALYPRHSGEASLRRPTAHCTRPSGTPPLLAPRGFLTLAEAAARMGRHPETPRGRIRADRWDRFTRGRSKRLLGGRGKTTEALCRVQGRSRSAVLIDRKWSRHPDAAHHRSAMTTGAHRLTCTGILDGALVSFIRQPRRPGPMPS